MRPIAQLAIVAVLGAAGYGGWHYWQVQQAETAKTNAAAAGARQGGGGPALAVEVAPVRTGIVVEKAEAVGTARANESVTITAKQTGYVASITFEEGQLVKTGQILLELETRERKAEVDQARNEMDQARATREDARQKLDRARQLKATGAITQAKVDELDQVLRGADARVRGAEARIRMLDARLDDVRITAPFDGRVGLRQVSTGALLQPGTPITTLDDLSKVKLDFSVPENFLGKLREGLAVQARTTAYPGRVFDGRVTVIDTRIDPVTRSVRVNALFDNREEALKPGMFISVELALDRRENAVMVDEEALVPEGARQFVFAVRDSRAVRIEVKLGTRLQGAVEVSEGLKPGEMVIVRGTSRVRPNMPVTARPFQRPAS
ncbi:MAG: efflux RND transporter periplasmic adaptor subunit [Alphaproteobacteria bacterium]|nr:efflux RND transporter periplasmic adaptor subunit [Alphaproteobacteria bacterium]